MRIEMQLLDNFNVTVDGQAVTDFRSDKARALLAYLVMEGTTPIRRNLLAELLWPGYPEKSARSSLRVALNNLNQLFQAANLLVITYKSVHFTGEAPTFYSDIQRLRLLALRDPATFTDDDWAQLALLPQGEFLPDFEKIDSQPFQHWLQRQRQHWRAQVTRLHKWRMLHSTSAAATAFQPLPRTFTPLVGRTAEVMTLARLVEDPRYPLIVIIGEGGIGKTRLALTIAEAAGAPAAAMTENSNPATPAAHFPHGIWFVPLVGVMAEENVADQLATTIGAVLGVPFRGQLPLQEQLVAWLRTRTLLLILDNIEHLLAGVPLLLAILQAAPGVKLLVTSRQRLNLQLALHFPVSELAIPTESEAASATPEQLLTYPSVQLFVERGQRAHPGFQLRAGNQVAVVQICRLVAGLPLALELAATLLEIYACQTIAEKLAYDYTLLATDQMDLPLHQRSLRAVLDASWRLLTVDEAQVLAQCALFRGEFTTEAVLVVTGVTPTQLRALVHKSLLRQQAEPTEHFSLHELVRHYAEERLADWPHLRQLATARHAHYYLELLARQGAAVGQQAEAMLALQREWSNVRAAWLAGAANGDTILLEQSLGALVRFYRLAGLYSEALQSLHAASAALREGDAAGITASLLARLLSHSAEFYRRLGRLADGERVAQEALLLGIEVDAPVLQAMAYHELAQLAHMRGDYPTMRTLAEEGCTQGERAQLPHLEAENCSDLGIAHMFLGNFQQAIQHHQRALQCLIRLPNRALEARFTSNLGFAYLRAQEYAAARHYITRALTLARLLQDQQGLPVRLIAMGELLTDLGVYEQAQHCYAEAWPIIQMLRDRFWESWLRVSWGRLALLCGDLTMAQQHGVTVLELVQQSPMRLMEQRALTLLGYTLAALGATIEAGDYFQRSLALSQQAGLVARMADPLVGLAELRLAQQDQAGALSLVEQTLELLARYGLVVTEALFRVYWICYRVLQAHDPPRALALLQQAEQLLQEQAAKIDDLAVRQAFVEQVTVNRAILAEAQAIRTAENGRLYSTHHD